MHDEREIEAVVEVLRGGPTALRIGPNVCAMERRVADLSASAGGSCAIPADRALLFRRWGRRSFIFDELGWNFEPSELSAAGRLVQLDSLSEKLNAASRTSSAPARTSLAGGSTSRCPGSPMASRSGGTCSRYSSDRVLECGLGLPNNHSLDEADCDYIGETVEAFLTDKGLLT